MDSEAVAAASVGSSLLGWLGMTRGNQQSEDAKVGISGSHVPLPWLLGIIAAGIVGMATLGVNAARLAWEGSAEIASLRANVESVKAERARGDDALLNALVEVKQRLVALETARATSDLIAVRIEARLDHVGMTLDRISRRLDAQDQAMPRRMQDTPTSPPPAELRGAGTFQRIP